MLYRMKRPTCILMKEFDEYFRKAKRTRKRKPKHQYVFGLACELLAKDWLEEREWKVWGSFRENFYITKRAFERKFTKFGQPIKELTKRQRLFIKDLTNFLTCDFYIYNKESGKFAIVEVKSTQRRTNTFDFASETQRKYYKQASELGIPIKFIFIKIFDRKVNEIRMLNYPEDLAIFRTKVRPKRDWSTKPKGITKKDVQDMKTLYAQGFTQKEIAEKFRIKASTVRYHLKKKKQEKRIKI